MSHLGRRVGRPGSPGAGPRAVAAAAGPAAAAGAVGGALAKLGAACALGAAGVPARDRAAVASGLSAAAWNVLFPSLLFASTVGTVHGQPASALAVAVGASWAQIGTGWAAGAGLAALAGLEGGARREAIVASAFGNATTLPLLLLGSLGASLPQLAGADAGDAVGFLSLYQLGWDLLLFTVGAAYLQGEPANLEPESTLARFATAPPLLASLAGLAVGLSPAYGWLQSDALRPVAEALAFLGSGAQPVLLLVLALSLAGGKGVGEGAGEKTAAPSPMLRQLAVTVAARGLAVPLLTLAGAKGYLASPGLTEPPTLLACLAIEGTVPSAQVLVLLAQMNRQEEDGGTATRLARLLFLQYLAMLPLTAGWASLLLGTLLEG